MKKPKSKLAPKKLKLSSPKKPKLGRNRPLHERVRFRMISHVNMGKKHGSIFECPELGVLCESWTTFNKLWEPNKCNRSFYENKPGSKMYDSLALLFEDRPDIREKAEKAFGKKS